eukprot:Rhum_TRINITY_DN13992_c0_g1::Rhum_TRINITY_DN13992_c0_g1_i4::g.66627::m.66627
MRDTMHRIGEYTQHFAHFNLSVPQLPSGTAQNALEFSLLRCLSSLKLVCPAIPPEVFPERFVVRRQPNYNDTKRLMCDMEVIMNQIPSFPVRTDVGEPQALMMKRCALGVAGREATVMTVSLLWAHSLSEEGNKASRYLIPYVALVEQLTLQHGGLVHKLVADRMMCTWNLNPGGWQGGTYTVRACAAAMAIAPGTAELFAHERIHVSVALTHGLLLAGNVGFEATDDNSLRRSTQPSCTLSSTEQKALMSAGSDVQQWEEPRVAQGGFKTYTVIGPPVELGARITYQQKFYNTATAVFCCGATAKRVGQVYVVKAVEPIHLSDSDATRVRVYALTGLAAGRSPEQVEALQRFHDAYKMFWERKFLEAEKAFRAYTKEYGYDNVVERLQTLIIQGHTVCEGCTKEVAHLSCKQMS